jgi:hypothetical protein
MHQIVRRIAAAVLVALAVATAGAARPAPATAQSTTTASVAECAEALAAYTKALQAFKAVLAERRGQIEAWSAGRAKLPKQPGQALYLARREVMSTYKDLTDLEPSRIGGPNKFGIPPAYLDAATVPLIEEYTRLFGIMQAPPKGAQASRTPFKDVADIARAVARAKGLDAATVDAAGRIALGIFMAETNGLQNLTNVRSDKYMGSWQTGVAEDGNGRAAWAALLPRIAALDPLVAARDAKETARIGDGDQRFNHWTGVRNGLMNAQAALLPQIPSIMRLLPDPIDQMKLFQLIQIIPSPTRAAIRSGDIETYRISEPRIMGYLRNNSIFTFGKADRARESATYRDILDAMWLFTEKFERAIAVYGEIKAGERRGAQ